MLRRLWGRLLHDPTLFSGLLDGREPVLLRDDAVVRRLVIGREEKASRAASNRRVLLRGQQDDRRAMLVLALAEVRVSPLGQLELDDLVVNLLVRRPKTRLVCGSALGCPSHNFGSSQASEAETGENARRWGRAKSGWPGTRPCFGSSTSASRRSPTASTSKAKVSRSGSSSSASVAG